jgi:hypothetical protein
MCDGISCMNFHIGQGDTFQADALMPFPRKITFIERLLIRASFPFYLPKLAKTFFSIKQDKNVLHDGKRELSGKKLCATSGDIKFPEVKAASK